MPRLIDRRYSRSQEVLELALRLCKAFWVAS